MESQSDNLKIYRSALLNFLPDTYTCIMLVYACIAAFLLKVYFLWDLNILFGFLLLPYLATSQKQQRSWRYLVPTLLSTGLALFLPVKTLLFVALVCAVLLLIESHKGKLNSSLFLLLFIISPVFKYISNVFSFPVRLWLTECAADFITLIGMPASAEGNLIKYKGSDFSVDQACAGLHMLSTSLILCLFITTFYQKKTNSSVSFFHLTGFLTLTVLLNILSNLIRIPVLVLFNIQEGTFLHDITGLLCLAVYVFIPLVGMTKFFFSHFAKPALPLNNYQIFQSLARPLPHPLVHIAFFSALIFAFLHLKTMDDNQDRSSNLLTIKGYKKENLKGGIVKFENNNALIYIKPTPFYAPEHNPMVCWSGSGYTFKYIRKEIINGNEIYTGTLVKGNDKIFTAWWFDNGTTKTINQMKWRWQSAKYNQRFYLVNVNASNQTGLNELIKKTKSILSF